MTEKGHRVYLEDDAGLEAGFPNEVYRDAGATVVYSEDDVLLRSELVIRVSPPPPSETEPSALAKSSPAWRCWP